MTDNACGKPVVRDTSYCEEHIAIAQEDARTLYDRAQTDLRKAEFEMRHAGLVLEISSQLSSNRRTHIIMVAPLYFGCWPRFGKGHYLYAPTGERIWTHPLGNWQSFNATYAPRPNNRRWRLTVHPLGSQDITLLARWDSTGDSRPNSNSVFILAGRLPLFEALTHAREAFPERFDQIKEHICSTYGEPAFYQQTE